MLSPRGVPELGRHIEEFDFRAERFHTSRKAEAPTASSLSLVGSGLVLLPRALPIGHTRS
jgi:hypothetical protein